MYRIQHFELSGPQARALPLPAGARLRVGSGSLWVTVEGRPEDIWLVTGACWQSPTALRLWLSAEPHAVFQVLRPVAGR